MVMTYSKERSGKLMLLWKWSCVESPLERPVGFSSIFPLQTKPRIGWAIDRALPSPALDIPIHRKDKDPLSELHIDIREEAQDFGTGDLADLLTEFVTALRD